MAPKRPRLLLDANVAYWLTYTKASNPALRDAHRVKSLVRDYSRYVAAFQRSGGVLLTCAFTFVEVANTIEHTELDLFQQQHGPTKLKDFRRTGARAGVTAEIGTAWSLLSSISTYVDQPFPSPPNMLALVQSAEIDAGDAVVAAFAHAHTDGCVLTDDADFIGIDKLEVHTANAEAIKSARRAKRFLR